MTQVLQLQAISKRFGSVAALREVDFALEAGEVHALLGENGAGKSTLMHVAYGMLRPDSGTIRVHGSPCELRSPKRARRLGLGMVHQHFTSVPALTVAENVALAGGWKLTPGTLERRVLELCRRTGMALDPRMLVADLGVELKQRLEIVKALAADATILVLDEPTAVLGRDETGGLLDLVRGFKARGISTVLITHKLDEALKTADRVTVLRRGRVVFSAPVVGVSASALAGHMLGERVVPAAASSQRRGQPGPVVVRCSGLRVARERTGGSGLRDGSLTAQRGEIVGIAAVEGNGQRELLRAIAGLVPHTAGTLEVEAPVAFIPEDRTTEGMLQELTLTQNLVLSQGRRAGWVRGFWLDWRSAERRTAELIAEFGVVASGPGASAASLSGGNQQKFIVAAALERRPVVVLAENPTRGLDLKAAAAVHERLRRAAAAGAAVVLYSSDFDEVLDLADRVVVLVQGVVTEPPAGSNRAEIGRLMLQALASGTAA